MFFTFYLPWFRKNVCGWYFWVESRVESLWCCWLLTFQKKMHDAHSQYYTWSRASKIIPSGISNSNQIAASSQSSKPVHLLSENCYFIRNSYKITEKKYYLSINPLIKIYIIFYLFTTSASNETSWRFPTSVMK